MDVARLAGVSQTTVSLVLNGKADQQISPETRVRVEAAAVALGYQPNRMARGLRTRKSDMIGFISDVVGTTLSTGAMLQGVQDAASEAGIVLLLGTTRNDPAVERRTIDTLHGHQVDGLIYATMHHSVVDVPEGIRDLSVVLLDARASDGSLPSVVPDDERGGYDATRCLINAGHRRIAFINTLEASTAAGERLAGYRRALTEAGIDPDPSLVAWVPHTLSDRMGEDAASPLLQSPEPPTAVFVYNDPLARGVYQAIRRAGLRIPQDVSVVGFDDQVHISAALDPGLTTMHLPHYEMGRWAAERLLSASADGTVQPTQCRMECPLVERGSVARREAP
jgi:LacI family transcriptional regulator